jgi:hypothetical protein
MKIPVTETSHSAARLTKEKAAEVKSSTAFFFIVFSVSFGDGRSPSLSGATNFSLSRSDLSFLHKRGIKFNRHSGESRNPGMLGLGILDAGSSPA